VRNVYCDQCEELAFNGVAGVETPRSQHSYTLHGFYSRTFEFCSKKCMDRHIRIWVLGEQVKVAISYE
jgi:endogenous inhibitor of DNA gyrase (YacG/DUF329 family)